MEERGRVSGDEPQSLEEVAESSGHFPGLLQQDQSTGGGYLWWWGVEWNHGAVNRVSFTSLSSPPTESKQF